MRVTLPTPLSLDFHEPPRLCSWQAQNNLLYIACLQLTGNGVIEKDFRKENFYISQYVKSLFEALLCYLLVDHSMLLILFVYLR